VPSPTPRASGKILVVGVEDDADLLVPAHNSRYLAEALGARLHVLSEAGHGIQTSHADELNQVLLEHWRRNAASANNHSVTPSSAAAAATLATSSSASSVHSHDQLQHQQQQVPLRRRAGTNAGSPSASPTRYDFNRTHVYYV
jgi:hypothetical protein